MKNFDLEKIRFLSIIAGMCIILILVVWKAFDYLPTENIPNSNNIEETVFANTNNQEYEDNSNYDNTEQDNDISSEDNEFASENIEDDSNTIETFESKINLNEKKKFLKPLETIYEDIATPQIKPQAKQQDKVEEKDDSMDEMLAKADEFYNDGAFDMAISEYQDIIRITENDGIKALCHENIKKIYENTGYKK